MRSISLSSAFFFPASLSAPFKSVVILTRYFPRFVRVVIQHDDLPPISSRYVWIIKAKECRGCSTHDLGLANSFLMRFVRSMAILECLKSPDRILGLITNDHYSNSAVDAADSLLISFARPLLSVDKLTSTC